MRLRPTAERTFTARRVIPRQRFTLGATWRTLAKDLFDPYRPERHYMRGPGPKWREKHGYEPHSAVEAAAPLAQAVA